jgi:hypothetical protein
VDAETTKLLNPSIDEGESSFFLQGIKIVQQMNRIMFVSDLKTNL